MSGDDSRKRRAAFNVASAMANLASHIHEGEGHAERELREQRRRVLLRGAEMLTSLLMWVGGKDGKANDYAIAVRRPAVVLAAGYTLLLHGRVPRSSNRIWLSTAEVRALSLPESGDQAAVTAANDDLVKAAELALTVEEATQGGPRRSETSLEVQDSKDRFIRRASALVERIGDLPGLDGRTRYNLACFYATIEDSRHALVQLRLAVASDSALAAWATGDPSLELLKEDPQFKAIVRPSAPTSTSPR